MNQDNSEPRGLFVLFGDMSIKLSPKSVSKTLSSVAEFVAPSSLKKCRRFEAIMMSKISPCSPKHRHVQVQSEAEDFDIEDD